MFAEHPASGVKREVIGSFHRLWCLLFGFLYYLSKGAWSWALISFITANGLFIGLPLFNRTIIRSIYENRGWRVYEDTDS